LSPYLPDAIVFSAAYRLQVMSCLRVIVGPSRATGPDTDLMTSWETT
jgi:hypothetical protein